jgi:AcrR family transcriptional regulator
MSDLKIKTKASKGEQTREHLLTTALQLFSERGYTATTMREIATTANCSLGLTYRYFGSKEEIVLALYQRLAAQMEQEAMLLPAGTLSTRFVAAMQADIKRLTPYRSAVGALFGAAFSPESEVSLLGEKAAPGRQIVQAAFAAVVMSATDVSSPQLREDLGKLLYAIHLLMVLYWLQDKTPDQRATQEMIGFAGQTLGRLRLLLRVPVIARLVSDLAKRVAAVTEPGTLL